MDYDVDYDVDYWSNFTDDGNTTVNQTELCTGTIEIERVFVNLAIIPAAFIVILMSFLQQRKRLFPSCCGRRPAVAFPVNLLDGHHRRWAYAAAFGVTTYKILLLFDGQYYFAPITFQDPQWMRKFGFVKVFIQMVNVVQVGIVYYPLFACVVYRKNMFANVFGFLYTAVWLSISLMSILICMETNSEIGTFVGEGQIIIDMVFYIPVAICYVVLLGGFIHDFVTNIRKCCRGKERKIDAIGDTEDYTQSEVYVRKLFTRETRRKPEKIVDRVKRKATYVNIPGLKYSPRVLCTMVVAVFALLKSAIELGFWLDVILRYLSDLLDTYGKDLIGLLDNNSTDLLYDRIIEGVYLTRISLGVCNGVSVLLHFVFMVRMVLGYRHHIRKYILGDRSWHYKCNMSPASSVVGSMRYSGYQIAFIIYGWFVMFLVLFIVMMVFAFLFAIPLRDGYSTFLIEKAKALWPTMLISLAILFAQKLLAKFVFLQDRGKYMALNNTRWFHVMSFFLFYFNVLLGLFSALKRIIISMIAGIVMLGRLDRVMMMRGAERFDSGFNSYLGVLHLEVYHTHPILRYFVECLHEGAHSRRKDITMATDDEDRELRLRRHRRRVLANKWFKAITLINNPTILVERLNRLIEQQKDGGGIDIKQKLHEALKQAHSVIDKTLIDGLSPVDANPESVTLTSKPTESVDLRHRDGHTNVSYECENNTSL